MKLWIGKDWMRSLRQKAFTKSKMTKTTILGAAESGIGAALLAQQLGHEVFVSDFGKIKDTYREELEKNKLPYEEGQHTEKRIFESDEVIKSPGIPDSAPIVQALEAKGIPVISEIEFASRHTNAKIIAITGSNGKTTTTNLTYQLLKIAGLNVGMAGNVGISFARSINEQQYYDYYVLELSSFQLDGIKKFRPDIAVLLNITPDHLDRYDNQMSNYARSKFRIAMNQTFEDLLILNYDLGVNYEDFDISGEDLDRLEARRSFVRMEFPDKSKIKVNQVSFDLSHSPLRGPHNQFNATCAVQIAKELGINDTDIQKGLNAFKNDPHRLESVGKINGVEYINDSKATNVDSTYYALKAMSQPTVLIMGGTDKGNDYRPLIELAEEKVKALICLGVDNEKLIEFFSPIIKNIEEAKGAMEAVQRASVYAEDGDAVLLSPACASFDLFENYKDRGDKFKEAVAFINS
ncbi:MAG: UDP-N-acetylmuramoylalanine--D-glutamate ligase [Saprospiraceae bacterium]|jgi:UDP-N-acetylmuramoylalanine--D-glutamate ligase